MSREEAAVAAVRFAMGAAGDDLEAIAADPRFWPARSSASAVDLKFVRSRRPAPK